MPTQALTRVLSFGRAKRVPASSPCGVFADAGSGNTPRLTPRNVTPRSTQTLAIEIERSSKTEPLGFKTALVSEYYSGVIVTEVKQKAADAGLKPGDCVSHVGSREVSTVREVEDALKCIAGSVVLQISRSKKLPSGWTAAEENGRAVLKLRIFDPAQTAITRPLCELTVSDVTPGSRGIELSTNSKGQTVIHSIKKDSVFAKHMRIGDSLVSVNGVDLSTNPLGAGRALTSASGMLMVCGTFLPSTAECAASSGCPCCTTLFGHRMARPVINLEAKVAQEAATKATSAALAAVNKPDAVAVDVSHNPPPAPACGTCAAASAASEAQVDADMETGVGVVLEAAVEAAVEEEKGVKESICKSR